MRTMTRLVALAVGVITAAGPALAWGPKGDVAVVTTAARVLSRDGRVPLAKQLEEIRQGASVGRDVLEEMFPLMSAHPVTAIESEMRLLSALRGDRVDPYFSYRLGMLGKLVAMTTTPMSNAAAVYRDRYYADVDARIENTPVRPGQRKVVDPRAYFERAIRDARRNDVLITTDYRDGTGFRGVASASLPEAVTNSVDAVADVWHTILRGPVDQTGVSESRKRAYILAALEFYINRASRAETESMYERLMGLGVATPDLHKRIGDMYFEAGQYDRAIEEYKTVLAAVPGRRDVSEKIASYYVSLGDEAMAAGPQASDRLEDERLTNARDAFAKALEFDALNQAAQRKLLDVEKQIADREKRRIEAAQAVDTARTLFEQADAQADQRNYAEAIKLLFKAREAYESVTEEFDDSYLAAKAGINDASARLRELRSELISSAQGLSGTGAMEGARRIAAQADGLGEKALQTLIRKRYDAAIKDLGRELRDAVAAE